MATKKDRPADPVAGLGPVGEVRLVPDTGSFVPLPWAPGAGAMVADLMRLDGQPWQACPRAFLKQAVDEPAAEGYELLTAFAARDVAFECAQHAAKF
jgi:glutamine synthetase